MLRNASEALAPAVPALTGEHYRRFLELWQDAHPELQPLVRQARQRLGEG
ncbi:MAG TPA: hypothetical protein VGR27_08585 [Longimicrobiaceae bacterium]|nr:hypothetical protein [Longimicrobiaceae bacterium]